MSRIVQRVNLYQPRFHPKKEIMTLGHSLIILAVVVAIFAALSWMKLQQLKLTEEQIASLEQRHQTMMARLTSIAAAANQRKQEAVTEEAIRDKEKELKARRELLGSLTGGKFGNREGFSGYLAGLARQHVHDTWITGLSVEQGGERLTIAGSTLKPELAPVYLQKLSNEEAFRGKTFSVLELSRQEKRADNGDLVPTDVVDFIFRTDNDDVTAVEEVGNGT